MHLSSITIRGFKSFPERTKLVFSPGVSVIVGPNGCGKSNITDAVLWALGEQSPLNVRGQSMQDMIYAGGEGVGPSRYAEVEVVLTNDEPAAAPGRGADEPASAPAAPGRGAEEAAGLTFAEVSVMRRYERGGEGDYRLNGARCRLADVVETLADANLGREMHSVISQGRVEEIVHSKPRQRRLLVEEAAGLGKHRKRRRRAQIKLERTQENLDRALDVEREARSRLRPLKRQAQAADIHARLEREGAELRARLLDSELAAHESELAAAERTASEARDAREGIEAQLAEANRRRSEIEEQLAERDRERTETWGRLSAVRAAHERLTVRSEALAGRHSELTAALERHRATLGSLASELAAATGARGGEDPFGAGLERIAEALAAAGDALDRARAAAPGSRAGELARVRERSEHAAGVARRLEELLGSRRQDSLSARVEAESELLGAVAELCEAAASARDAAGERAASLERRMLGEAGGGEDVTERLRACSREEAEIQARLRSASEAVTEAEVAAAHLRDRRAEAVAELGAIGRTLGRELEPTGEVLDDAGREEIERKLERLARRREQLGPVNPLAEREYEDALAHVSDLETQRSDLDAALAELQGLIRETDRKINDAFEQTFEATRKNFEELVEHLFPGGRGRLRLVGEQGPRPVLGGEVPAEEAGDDEGEEFQEQGVEIEVTPAGKATRKLSLLSGGEKSLVALAFVFAVFLARPSPFYILDEVEAALDDANIDRFLQLLRRFSDRAQFIVVTHQKRTMDAADVLYGVSMGKGGVTKVVSRRFDRQGGEQPALDEASAAA